MTDKIKPLEVLIFEDQVELDDLEKYSQYSESDKGLELQKDMMKHLDDKSLYDLIHDQANGEFMKVVAKESKFPMNITLRGKYQKGIENLAKDKDILITDIGIPGPRYDANLKIDFDEVQKYLVNGFEKLYGKDWANLSDGNHIKWNIFQDPRCWWTNLIKKLEHQDVPSENWYLYRNIAGLTVATELEKQGRKVTMYPGDLRHQMGIHYGLLDGIISPSEFVEIYQKHKKVWEERPYSLIDIGGPVAINNGRIAIGKTSVYKTVKDYVKAIQIALDYQIGGKMTDKNQPFSKNQIYKGLK